jgi:hypothetical protein
MDTQSGELIEHDEAKILKALSEKRELVDVPKRFRAEAAALVERAVVPTPAFASWAQRTRASATRKRKRKIAQTSKRRNRR